MNREIEFRGKRLDNGEWLHGDLMHDNRGGCYIYPLDAENLYTENKVALDTVGQFTGLLDKNGKEIYEGDILKHGLSNIPFGVVTWHSFGYFYILESRNFNKENYVESRHATLGAMLDYVDFEVIGNIYDNIGLIKVNE